MKSLRRPEIPAGPEATTRSGTFRIPVRLCAVLALTLIFPLTSIFSRAESAELPRTRIGRDGARLLLVPAGKFRKGSTRAEIRAAARMARRYHPGARPDWYGDEVPAREVFLPAFYIDETEVSILRYRWRGNPPRDLRERSNALPALINGRAFRGRPSSWDVPVTNISWKEAAAYCRSVGRRLPTSDEWEKAARGTDGRIFPWGNRFDPARLNSYEAGLRSPVTTGSHPSGASPYGALDMAGNVWEWTADWYDPASRKSGRRRVIRGGGWGYGGAFARAANLGAVWPGERHPSLGFRCVVSP